MDHETHYDVLGAPRSSTAAELKQAYRRALRTSHPDVGGSAESFRLVQDAWAVLGDPTHRAEYDRLYMPQTPTPPPRTPPRQPTPPPTAPQGGTRRERASSRRAAGQEAPSATATPTFATVHGHPGGSSRARYVDISREWMLSPQPPRPPAKPLRIRHERDRFLHMWGVVSLQLFLPLLAVFLILVLIAGTSGNLPTGSFEPLLPALRQVAVGVFGVAFLCGGAIAMMRLVTSPARAEVRRVRANNRKLYAFAQQQFAADVWNRPSDPRAFLSSPFAADSVEIAPSHARTHLHRALAQEAIANALKALNAEFTVWHDVQLAQAYASHLVVGPQGVFLVEPLLERSRIDPGLISQLTNAIGVTGITGILFVDLDPAAVNAPPAKLGEWPALTWRIGPSRLASTLSGGIHGIQRGEDWEVRQLVDRVARRVAFA